MTFSLELQIWFCRKKFWSDKSMRFFNQSSLVYLPSTFQQYSTLLENFTVNIQHVSFVEVELHNQICMFLNLPSVIIKLQKHKIPCEIKMRIGRKNCIQLQDFFKSTWPWKPRGRSQITLTYFGFLKFLCFQIWIICVFKI